MIYAAAAVYVAALIAISYVDIRERRVPNAIVLPQLSVQQGSNGHLVYVVKADGTAELRPVVVGDYQGDKDIVVLSGLQAGDRKQRLGQAVIHVPPPYRLRAHSDRWRPWRNCLRRARARASAQ